MTSRDVFDPFRYRFGLVDRGGTGRFLFGVRWYDPGQGVWVQQDSLDVPFGSVNGNRYVYAGSDSVNNLDPTGLYRWEDLAGDVTGTAPQWDGY
ncbi:MAG: RHS repeat-associated core domain-containing protein [Rothia sp. (in: high G+C Gram-positive bacteria)]|nr:RHS repeat-associated core domain-containing protein [Rothia sp. (in: high G+C Gram-positive bacteria)]